MNGRERLLTALSNEKPDRLPCQVHNWMPYYLKTYLGGINQYQAYEQFGMDLVIYVEPRYVYSEKDLSNWKTEIKTLNQTNDTFTWIEIIETPKGQLSKTMSSNKYTSWDTKHLIKTEKDFEIWNHYVPVPHEFDWAPVLNAKNKIGDKGIVRSHFFDFGQCSPWQSFCFLFGTEQAIIAALDKPDWVEYVLKAILTKKMQAIETAGKFELDLVEIGGGAGSSTVISPDMHRRFCLPYDKVQIEMLHEAGTKVVYHLCGGLMPLLKIVAENGADALETMTPSAMGGDCNLVEAAEQVGNRLCFIGGFDQNRGFENGNPELVNEMVIELFKTRPQGGYICSPSDHFFFGSPKNIQAFADTAKNCYYS